MYHDIRDIGGVKIAAIGPATAARVEALHLQVDLQPKEFVAEAIVKEFDEQFDIENQRFLLPRADLARDALPEGLEALGAIVDKVECYRTVPEVADESGNLVRLLAEGADVITFTSSSTVENFCNLVDLRELLAKFPQMKLASIGPITSETIRKRGFNVGVEAAQHDISGLTEAVKTSLMTRNA